MTDSPTVGLPAPGPERVVAGRYALTALCGRGGSAEVWAATDTALDRQVAVKLVTSSGGEDAGRVGDEARLLARLSHPGLVSVYDAGTDETGRPWVVMELVVGETLSEMLRRGPLPSWRTAEIGRTLAEALDHVHAQGLVHRDVKPANVLIARDGRVRLTDFGIARLVDAARVTATGLTVGTASFLAPEQVTGSAVGPAADVYALGLVLLECLTGRREYPGSAVEVALARLHRPPEIPEDLPDGWPALLRSMTATEAEERPSAADVAGQLAVVTAGGTATRPIAVDERTRVLDRTGPADATSVIERPPLDRPPLVRPAPAPGTSPAVRRARLRLAAILAVVAAVVVLVAIALLSSSHGTPGSSAPVSPQLPSPLRSDLHQLQQEAPR